MVLFVNLVLIAVGIGVVIWFGRAILANRRARQGADQLDVGDTIVMASGRTGQIVGINTGFMSATTYRVHFGDDAAGYETLIQPRDIVDWSGPGWEEIPEDER